MISKSLNSWTPRPHLIAVVVTSSHSDVDMPSYGSSTRRAPTSHLHSVFLLVLLLSYSTVLVAEKNRDRPLSSVCLILGKQPHFFLRFALLAPHLFTSISRSLSFARDLPQMLQDPPSPSHDLVTALEVSSFQALSLVSSNYMLLSYPSPLGARFVHRIHQHHPPALFASALI